MTRGRESTPSFPAPWDSVPLMGAAIPVVIHIGTTIPHMAGAVVKRGAAVPVHRLVVAAAGVAAAQPEAAQQGVVPAISVGLAEPMMAYLFLAVVLVVSVARILITKIFLVTRHAI